MTKPLYLRNNTTENKTVIGVVIQPQEIQAYSQYSFQTLRSSDEIMNMIANGDLIVNDGTHDMAAAAGYAYVVNEVTVNPTFLGEGMTIPIGETATRPTSALQGTVRFNTTLNALEVFVANAWVGFDASMAKQKRILSAHKSDVQFLAKTEYAITFNNFPRIDPIFQYSNNAFIFLKAGWYRVTVNLAFDIDSNKETTTESWLTLNEAVLPASRAYTYSAKKGNGEASTIITTFINAPASGRMQVVSRVKSGSAPDILWSLLFPSGNDNTHTMSDACRVMIEEID